MGSLDCGSLELSDVLAPGKRRSSVSMRKLSFGFFDDGLPRDSRILMFYSFETEESLARSGILHYHMGEGRFVGPRHDSDLLAAAREFMVRSGRIPPAES